MKCPFMNSQALRGLKGLPSAYSREKAAGSYGFPHQVECELEYVETGPYEFDPMHWPTGG